jgi:PP-loop superfamily ATP-utilizing enzyme
MHGEMPEFFNPKIWWISLGMNDLARLRCSEEVVVIGILRVVEEILERKPHARVVINSLLPMAVLREGAYPLISDVEDSFSQVSGKYVVTEKDGERVLLEMVQPLREIENRPPDRMVRGNRRLAVEHQNRATPNRELEENEQEKANKEELDRDQQSRKSIRDRANPTLRDDQTRIRKFNPGFISKKKIPIFASIRAINRELKQFAVLHGERVTFFDSTSIFTEKKDDTSFTLLSSKISARGHPTPLGYSEWEDAVADRLKQLLAVMKASQPELFAPNEVSHLEDKLDRDANNHWSGHIDDWVMDDKVELTDSTHEKENANGEADGNASNEVSANDSENISVSDGEVVTQVNEGNNSGGKEDAPASALEETPTDTATENVAFNAEAGDNVVADGGNLDESKEEAPASAVEEGVTTDSTTENVDSTEVVAANAEAGENVVTDGSNGNEVKEEVPASAVEESATTDMATENVDSTEIVAANAEVGESVVADGGNVNEVKEEGPAIAVEESATTDTATENVDSTEIVAANASASTETDTNGEINSERAVSSEAADKPDT